MGVDPSVDGSERETGTMARLGGMNHVRYLRFAELGSRLKRTA